MAELDYGPAPSRTLDLTTKAYVDSRPTGGSGGSAGVGVPTFLQQTAPSYGGGPYIWYQTDSTGAVVKVWYEPVGTNVAPTTGLVERFRVSNVTGATDGGTVSTLTAETGGTVLNATAGAATYVASGTNSRPALRFSGAQGYGINGTGPTAAQPLSIVMVVNLRAVNVGMQELLHAGGAEVLADTSYQSYHGTLVSGGTTTTGMHLIVSSITGGNATIAVDGTTVATGSGGVGDVQNARRDLGWNPQAGRYTQMDYYEHLIYNVDLANAANAATLNQLKAYVRSTYAMTIA